VLKTLYWFKEGSESSYWLGRKTRHELRRLLLSYLQDNHDYHLFRRWYEICI